MPGLSALGPIFEHAACHLVSREWIESANFPDRVIDLVAHTSPSRPPKIYFALPSQARKLIGLLQILVYKSCVLTSVWHTPCSTSALIVRMPMLGRSDYH